MIRPKKYKCSHCKQDIVVTIGNRDMIFWKNRPYHTPCFFKMCNEKIKKNDRYSKGYQDALDDIENIKLATKDRLNTSFSRDILNEHLLSHYNIIKVPERFWNVLSGLNIGIYNKTPCNAISISKVVDMWLWGQKNLDKIDFRNKRNQKNITGADRLFYDLSVLINHVDDYDRHISKIQVEEEIKKEEKVKEKINYKKIEQKKQNDTMFDDISDFL